ncbi:MAG TPA: hypothetical protein DIU00_12940 [Phycisphaerales bacterium]|nr:hypothetical protein [Phycisphaerales bacterium]
MIPKKVLIVLAMLGLFAGAIAAEEAYHLVKIWPEAPQGWHFYQPRGVAVDQTGNVYVGDSGNYRVKKFDAEGRFITQWGSPGQGDGQFSEIRRVKVGSSGTVYVVDENDRPDTHSRIQKFTPYGQFIGLFERTAPGADKVKLSIGVTEDDRGNIFVFAVDYVKKERRIRRAAIEKYSADGKFIAQWEMDAGSGDGQLQLPAAMALDAKGNIYIADRVNNRVQKFDPSGKFLMKWGSPGQGEDDFSFPHSIVVDKSGDVYVLDSNGVQKFTAEGEFLARWKMKIRAASRGIALDSYSNIYVTCVGPHAVLKLDNAGKVISQWGCADTGDGQFVGPGNIAVDSSGHILVADSENCLIQRFTSEGRFVSKWGGQTWTGINGMATDASGNLYVACGEAEVQKYNPEGKLIFRWGSSGSADGQFQYASSIALGPSGNVYVADENRVQKFTSEGEFLAKWGTEGTEDGQFTGLFFIEVDGSGNMWVGDQLGGETHRMQKFDANGKFLMSWTRNIMRPRGTNYMETLAVDPSGNNYYAFENQIEKYDAEGNLVSAYCQQGFSDDKLERVFGVFADQEGCLYVTDASGSIRRFDTEGKLAHKWTAENVEGVDKFPNGPITMDETGNIYVSYPGGVPIWKLSADGKPVIKFRIESPLCEDRFTRLGGVAVDNSGGVYAVDSTDIDWIYFGIPSIKKFDLDGQLITTWDVSKIAEGKTRWPAQIAVDSSGNMYVTDQSSHSVHKLDAQGRYIKSWGDKGMGDGQFDTPEGIAVDKSGNVLVCDRQNSRIQKFDSNGKFLTKWGKEGSGDGEFHFPAAVVVDKEGIVFVADSDNHRIQKFTAEGKFLTEWGQFGEAPGQFNVPLGIAVDTSGNVYVSDSHNHRIQKFAPVRSP